MQGNKKAHWLIAVAVLGGLFGVAASLKPWQKQREQQRQAQESAQELRAAQKEHEQLVEKQVRNQTETGQEALARERGYKLPEERPWVPDKK